MTDLGTAPGRSRAPSPATMPMPGSPATWSPSAVPMPSHAPPVRGKYRFAESARSPLPLATVALAAIVAVVACGVVASSKASGTISDVDIETGSMVALVGLAVVALVASIAWLRQIGVNDRSFGLPLVLLSCVPWESLALWSDDHGSRTVEGLMAQVAFAIVVMLVAGFFLRRIMITKIWYAGGLPAPVLSILLWLPQLALTVTVLATALVNMAGAKTRTSTTAFYQFTQTTWDPVSPALVSITAVVAAVSALAAFLVLLTVTIAQHIGVRRDQAARRRAREVNAAPTI